MSAPSTDTNRSRDPNPSYAPTQIVAVIFATGLSWAYWSFTHQFIEGVPPIEWTPILIQLVLIVLVGAGSVAVPPALESSKDLIDNAFTISPKAALNASVAGLFLVSLQCIFLLGYLTRDTGGTFYSPYVQPLLAIALLAPVVARLKDTVVLIAVAVTVVFALFGDWEGGGAPKDMEIPIWLYFLTPMAAMVIGLLNPLFGRSRDTPIRWRRETR